MTGLDELKKSLDQLKRRINSGSSPFATIKAYQPSYMAIYVNDICNLRCRMCYKWTNGDNSDKPDPANWRRLFGELRDIVEPGFTINITGGEPLLSEETFTILALARKFGYLTQMPTNGTLLDGPMITRLTDLGLGHVTLSLDAQNPELHDRIRGRAGSHRKVLEAIERLAKSPIGINICSVIMKPNLAEIIPLAESVSADKRINMFVFQALAKPFNLDLDDDWNTTRFADLWPDDLHLLQTTLDHLAMMAENNPKMENKPDQLRMFFRYFNNYKDFVRVSPCTIDQAALNINEYGELFFCLYRGSLGNIKHTRLRDLLDDRSLQKQRNIIATCRENCQSLINCNFKDMKWA